MTAGSVLVPRAALNSASRASVTPVDVLGGLGPDTGDASAAAEASKGWRPGPGLDLRVEGGQVRLLEWREQGGPVVGDELVQGDKK